MRRKSDWINCANTLTKRVFPVPGTPSKMMCPPANKAINVCLIRAGWPTTI